MIKPRVCVLRTAGTNCDKETAFAFIKAGAAAEFVHINSLVSGEKTLADFQILAFPGGFSYGDDVAAGKILANELRTKMADGLRKFIEDGKLMIGICNGFQIMVKAGLLPGSSGFKQETSLIINDSGKFEDRWVHLKTKNLKGNPSTALRINGERSRTIKSKNCVWTKNLPEVIYLPVAHGEGKFVVRDKKVLDRLKHNGQIVFQYCDSDGKLSGYPDNPNGSVDNIAGICDTTGRILGLMPHPERHISFEHHPRWTSMARVPFGNGLQIFRNGVEYVRKYLKIN